jgi:hypothetical protein
MLDPDEFPMAMRQLIPRWQRLAQDYYDLHGDRAVRLENDIDAAREEAQEAEDAYVMYCAVTMPIDDEPEPEPAPATEVDTRPELFSKFDDKKGYNGRVISKSRIDSIVTTVFNHRKKFQVMKMKCLDASILKIDFNYKIARKIRVSTGRGKSSGKP